MTAENDFFRC